MKNRFFTTAAFMLAVCICVSNAQCPNVNPIYQDLENWVHANAGPGKHNGIIAQVTIINQATSGGTHFFTGYGVSCFTQGVSPYGQCNLTTNPGLNFVYSDRYSAAQPFDVNNRDLSRVSLDMVNNKIISTSQTWHTEVTYTNVTRTGNIIYAMLPGSMVIINIKKLVQGQVDDC